MIDNDVDDDDALITMATIIQNQQFNNNNNSTISYRQQISVHVLCFCVFVWWHYHLYNNHLVVLCNTDTSVHIFHSSGMSVIHTYVYMYVYTFQCNCLVFHCLVLSVMKQTNKQHQHIEII